MPLAALLLVRGAAFCHSGWSLLVKSDARRLEIQSGALVVGTLLCAPVVLVYSLGEISAAAWTVILVSGVLETSYVFALTAAYGAGDLSLVYPVARGIAPVLVAPLAVAFLGERLSAQGLAGIALVVVGIFLSPAAVGGAAARAPVSYVVAGREVSIVVAAVLGAVVLGERHWAVRIVGAGVIFAGLCVMALAR